MRTFYTKFLFIPSFPGISGRNRVLHKATVAGIYFFEPVV